LVVDRKGDVLLLVGRQCAAVLASEGERKVVEGTAHRLKSIADDKAEDVWKRLHLFADEFKASLAIGFHRNFVTLVVNPPFGETFPFLNVALRPGELSAVVR
jgi:hypothetical protein